MARSVFLTAEWKNLVHLTWAVDPARLEGYLPKGVVPEIIDGMAYVSLLTFDFVNTKVKGLAMPVQRHFPEINLLYHVKYQGMRGVSYLQKFVPKHCIAVVARRFYNAPYLSYPMESRVEESADGQSITIAHKIWKDGECHSLEVAASPEVMPHGDDSADLFMQAQTMGVGRDGSGKTMLYNVEHAEWEMHQVTGLHLNMDFGKLYGPEWAFLNDKPPVMARMARGSAVKVLAPEAGAE